MPSRRLGVRRVRVLLLRCTNESIIVGLGFRVYVRTLTGVTTRLHSMNLVLVMVICGTTTGDW